MKEKLTVKVSSLKTKFPTAIKPMKKRLIVHIHMIFILSKKVVWLKKIRRNGSQQKHSC